MIARTALERLDRQGISCTRFRTPAQVVAWFGAVQAQEFGPAKWALGLRLHGRATDADISRAFDQGLILRTHVMRPTWHFVAAQDIVWLLELTAPRVQRIAAVYNRHLGLDVRTLTRGTSIVERVLRDRQFHTRLELAGELARRGLQIAGQRLAHLMMHAELEAVVCSGPRRGKQSTYALVAERAPARPRLSRDEALAELTRRFFRSHGPATIRDFVWWSGLTAADARRGLEINKARAVEIEGLRYWTTGRSAPAAGSRPGVHLLPIYDEYLVAYRDRVAVPHWPSTSRPPSGRIATFQHALVIDGQVAGTWRTSFEREGSSVKVYPTRRLTAPERRSLHEAIARYDRFVTAPAAGSGKAAIRPGQTSVS